MAAYTKAQFKAIADALELTTQAIEKITGAQIPLGAFAVPEAQAHLFRAHAYLIAILRNAGYATAGTVGTATEASVHKDDTSF